jgi:hypothetical protein
LARFTIEQKNISGAMKLLIDLYHRFLETDEKDWFSDEIIHLMAKMFDLTIPNFSPCLYFQKSSKFRFREKNESIRLSEFQIKDFLTLMNAFHADISSGISSFFRFSERIVKTQVKADLNTLSHVKHNTIENMPLCKIIHPISEDADTDSQSEYYDTIYMTLNDPPDEYESFRLQVMSDCALDNEFIPENGATVSCPGYTEAELPFMEAVQYLLVKYEYLLGSFERVKVCKQCRKLFVEKKLGAGQYCSDTCRKTHYDSMQPEEKRLCRERQNAWIRYRGLFHYWPRVFNIQKDDCLNCQNIAESGKCPILIKKNERNFKKYAQANLKKT